MSAIIIPRKHLRQPQGRVSVDWSHPLARGLVALCTPQGELVAGTPALPPVGDWSAGVNQHGRIARGPASDSLAYWSIPLAQPAVILEDFSLYLFGGASTTGLFPALSTVNTGSLGVNAIQLSLTQAQAKLDNNNGPLAPSNSLHGVQVFAVRSGNKVSTLVNGVNAGSSTTGTRTGTITELFFGRSKTSNTAAGTWAVYAALWTRAVSDLEAAEHYRYPWQLFRADPIRIYSLPTGAISINSITASNITQTGATITLGLTR